MIQDRAYGIQAMHNMVTVYSIEAEHSAGSQYMV